MLLINRLLLILCLSCSALILEGAPVFTLANEAYQNKDFTQAISLYKESLKSSQSFSQYFNLGNAYYENKEYGQAILQYEKALTIEPKNVEALRNLERTYGGLQISPERVGTVELITHMFSANTWTWIAIIVVFIGLAAFCLQLFASEGNHIAKMIMWSCIVLCVLLIGVNTYYAGQVRWGVVIKNEAPLRISPTKVSPVTGLLLEGTKAKKIKTKEKVDGFILIKTPSTKEGWISKEDFEMIW